MTGVTQKINKHFGVQDKKPSKSECDEKIKPNQDDRNSNSEGILLPISDEEKALLQRKSANSNNSMDIQESLSTSEDSKSDKMDIIQEGPNENAYQQRYDALECYSPCNELIGGHRMQDSN